MKCHNKSNARLEIMNLQLIFNFAAVTHDEPLYNNFGFISLRYASIHNHLEYREALNPVVNEPHREKTGFLPRRKQRRRSASR